MGREDNDEEKDRALLASLTKAIDSLSENLGKWQALNSEATTEGFKLVAEAISALATARPPGPSVRGAKFMYNVSVDEPNHKYTIDLTSAVFEDDKGNVVPNEQCTAIPVSDNPAVTVTPDPDDGTLIKTGTLAFGPTPGDANVLAPIVDTKTGKTLGVIGGQFHVVVGAASQESGGTFSVEGLTNN